MSVAKIQTGDQVKVIAGSYKGTVGQVINVRKAEKKGQIVARAAVSTIPKIVKYRRSIKASGYPGQMFMVDRFVDISNLMLITAENIPSKSKIITDKDGKKQRQLKKNDAIVTRQRVVIAKDDTTTTLDTNAK